MKLLLDTQLLLWAAGAPQRLSGQTMAGPGFHGNRQGSGIGRGAE
jgi:hypothetical protein